MKKDNNSKYKEYVGDGLLYFLLRLWCYNNKVPRNECARLNRYFSTNHFFAHVAYSIKLSNASTQFKFQKYSADLFEEFMFDKYLKKGFDNTYLYYEKNIIPLIEKQTIIKR